MLFNIGPAYTGETLIVSAPAGVTVSASKDTVTKTKIADSNGIATFKGLTSGIWTLSITDGAQFAYRIVEIVSDYKMSIVFFAATITVTYPEGSTCTCSDGVTTLTAEDTTGSYTFTVPNAGTWTVSSTDGEFTKSETVEITSEGQNSSVELLYRLYLFNNGNAYEDVTGGWTKTNRHIHTTNPKTPTLNLEGNAMTVSYTSPDNLNWAGGTVETVNEIDLTNFSTLYFNVTKVTNPDSLSAIDAKNKSEGSNGISIGVMKETVDSPYTFAVHQKPVTGMNELDVSGITGTHKICINVVGPTKTVSVTTDSIYLE